ncbi:MAG TPA: alpha/beta hydrolase fold domain-containing protein [Acidimicrobiales bacterium]
MTARSPRRPRHPEVHLVADVQLRGRAGPLAGRVHWPNRTGSRRRPALLVFLPGGRSGAEGLDEADDLCRALCRHAGVVVLAVGGRAGWTCFQTAALEDAVHATGWAADHAAELGADPQRVHVAGEALGGRVAAAVALHARDDGWPAIARQLLIRPVLGASPNSPGLAGRDVLDLPADVSSLAGVAPATVVITVDDGPHVDDTRRYAARLRRAGVDVDELRYDGLPHHGAWPLAGTRAELIARDLARRSLDVRAAGAGPHGEAPA